VTWIGLVGLCQSSCVSAQIWSHIWIQLPLCWAVIWSSVYNDVTLWTLQDGDVYLILQLQWMNFIKKICHLHGCVTCSFGRSYWLMIIHRVGVVWVWLCWLHIELQSRLGADRSGRLSMSLCTFYYWLCCWRAHHHWVFPFLLHMQMFVLCFAWNFGQIVIDWTTPTHTCSWWSEGEALLAHVFITAIYMKLIVPLCEQQLSQGYVIFKTSLWGYLCNLVDKNIDQLSIFSYFNWAIMSL
jgi:hypothetical protein